MICSPCGGRGTTFCPTRGIVCATCKGRGYLRNPEFHETGEGTTCRACEGAGGTFAPDPFRTSSPCPACQDGHTVPCSFCDGRGYSRLPDEIETAAPARRRRLPSLTETLWLAIGAAWIVFVFWASSRCR